MVEPIQVCLRGVSQAGCLKGQCCLWTSVSEPSVYAGFIHYWGGWVVHVCGVTEQKAA